MPEGTVRHYASYGFDPAGVGLPESTGPPSLLAVPMSTPAPTSSPRHTAGIRHPGFILPVLLAALAAVGDQSIASTVSGRVTTPEGTAVPNVQIRIDQIGGETPPWNAATDAEGRYSVSDPLLFGNLEVVASAPNTVFLPAKHAFFDPGFSSRTANFTAHLRSPVLQPTASLDRFGLRLTGSANALGLPTEGWFELGVPPLFDQRTTSFPVTGSDLVQLGTVIPVPLVPATQLQARLVVSNSLGRSEGPAVLVRLPRFRPIFTVGGAVDPDAQALAVGDAGADGFMDVHWLRRAVFEDPAYLSGTGPLEWSAADPCPTCPDRVSLGDIAAGQWMDWNHDNLPDLLLHREFSGHSLFLGSAAGLGSSTNLPADSRQKRPIRHSALSDLDVDGIEDLILTAQPSFWVRPDGASLQLGQSFPIVGEDSSLNAADFNGDGWPDLLLATALPSEQTTLGLFPGNGSGGFESSTPRIEIDRSVFASEPYFSVGIADTDGDGTPDIVTSTRIDEARIDLRIYWNDGNGAFSHRFATTIENARVGEYAVPALPTGDFDGDGIADVLLPGSPARIISAPAQKVRIDLLDGVHPAIATMAPFDADGDGRLDIVAAGDGKPSSLQIFRNFAGPTNQPPANPLRLRAAVQAGRIAFQWQPGAADDLTPTPSLTWNIRVGTTPGGSEIVSPLADAVSGRRFVLRPGNAGHNRFLNLRVPPSVKRLYWSVQAVDAGHLGGPWSAERTLSLESTPTLSLTDIIASPAGPVRVRAAGNWIGAILHRSTDLDEWEPVAPFLLRDGSLEASDPFPPSAPAVFYMAR